MRISDWSSDVCSSDLGTFFRYMGDSVTYIARYDDLGTGHEEPIDLSGVVVSNNGIELQDREFIAAINERREPNSSVCQVLDCYRVIGELAASLEARSEENTSELQSLMRISYAVYGLKKKQQPQRPNHHNPAEQQHKHNN